MEGDGDELVRSQAELRLQQRVPLVPVGVDSPLPESVQPGSAPCILLPGHLLEALVGLQLNNLPPEHITCM